MPGQEPEIAQPLLVDELAERLERFRIPYDRDAAASDGLVAVPPPAPGGRGGA